MQKKNKASFKFYWMTLTTVLHKALIPVSFQTKQSPPCNNLYYKSTCGILIYLHVLAGITVFFV